MSAPVALLLTDLVDSAALAQSLGDAAMGRVSAAHDRLARDLLRRWNGREIDKTDGFLLLFTQATEALGYALDYHRALATLNHQLPELAGRPDALRARAGLHVGEVQLRETPAADVALGAKPIEVDGVTKPLAARVMSTALGGQTLITTAARDALEAGGPLPQRLMSHGFWQVKGIPVPIELFEVGEADAPFTPPPDGDKVYRVLRQGDLWLPLRETRHSLPAERDAFVGRRSTLQELTRRFDEGARLVSLLGIGGSGKTRLAVRFGWTRLGEFPGGVWFCDLSAARSVEGLVGAVAQGLDVPLGREDPVQQLGRAIAGRGPCLLVLDNFEQLARYAEATLGPWLERAPAARFLVTTREVLGIAGEQAVALAPLQPADAESLFVKRAQAARRDFQLGPDEQAAIAQLVKLLDHLPLAIELAAARVRTLAPRALLARMSERFKLLASSGSRVDRQATLRATFDWSWELLAPPERSALAQLSVFEGGFTLEAAEAVLDLAQHDDAPWAMDLVQSLVDKSFVRALPDERFDLLGSVQAYAHERLLAEPAAADGTAALQAAWARHAAWFAQMSPRAAEERGAVELDNLVAAVRRSTQEGQAELASAALVAAWAALALQGPFRVGVELAQALCQQPGLSDRAAAAAHRVHASALVANGQRAAAAEAFAEALSRARSAGDTASESAATVGAALIQARQGQVDAALAGLQQALALARRVGDALLEGQASNGLGMVEFEAGRLEPARQHYESALAIARRAGLRRLQTQLLGNLGNLHASAGRMAMARTLSEETLQVAREIGDRKTEGNTLGNLVMLYQLLERLPEAAAAGEQALVVARDLGHPQLESVVLCNLGLVRDALGDHAAAQVHLESAMALSQQLGDRRGEGQALGFLGLCQARQQQPTEARERLDAGRALLEGAGDPISLALLLSCDAEAELLADAPSRARQRRDEAAALARAAGVGRESELGLALARLARLPGMDGGAGAPSP